MTAFDYTEPAEVFASRIGAARHASVIYRRFDSAAAAIQYAVEELSPDFATGTFLEAGDLRLCYAEIKSLYEDAAFPLPRDGPVAGP